MKKGFTLIEILAVMVIMAIIGAIAIPQMLKIIEESKVEIVLKNNNLLISTTKQYLMENRKHFPVEIGETKEITMEMLKESKNLNDIRNPLDKNETCNGYVLVTKIDEGNFDYTPHIKCGININNIEEDGLLAHYKFDDFQEATRNVILTDGQGTSSPILGDGSPSLSIIDPDVTFQERKVVKYRTGSSGNFYLNGSAKLSTSTNSTNWTSTFYIKRVDNQPITSNIGTYMYLTNNSNVNALVAPIPVGNNWYKIVRTRSNVSNGYPTLIGCYSLGANTEYYISNWLMEPKPYATPFLNSLKESKILDYSLSSNDITLDYSSTPKWIYDEIKKSGAYEFNGSNSYIDLGYGLNQSLNNHTITLWVKSKAISPNLMFLSSGQEFGANDRFYFGIANGKWDMGIKTSGWGSSGLVSGNTNWNHIVITLNGTQAKMYVNNKITRTINYTSYTLKRNLHLGKHDNNYYFNGSIDDVRIYNRVLSEQELHYIYNSTK